MALNKAKGLIKFRDGAHFYTKEGEARHEADLRMARKLNLYASPTSIWQDQHRNFFLERYKMEQFAAAAGDSMRQPHETVKDYAQRLYEKSLEHAETAGSFGTAVHKAINEHPKPCEDGAILPFYEKWLAWHDANVLETIASEIVIVDHDLLVAGTCDRINRMKDIGLAMPDWKTQGVKKDDKGRWKPNFYDAWKAQLAFYSVGWAKKMGQFPTIPACVSVIINSTEPTEPFVKVYDPEEIRDAYEQMVMYANAMSDPRPKGFVSKSDWTRILNDLPLEKWPMCLQPILNKLPDSIQPGRLARDRFKDLFDQSYLEYLTHIGAEHLIMQRRDTKSSLHS